MCDVPARLFAVLHCLRLFTRGLEDESHPGELLFCRLDSLRLRPAGPAAVRAGDVTGADLAGPAAHLTLRAPGLRVTHEVGEAHRLISRSFEMSAGNAISSGRT